MLKYLRQGIILIGLVVLLTACPLTKVTKQNYDKIQEGMNYQQVTEILGPPKSTDTISIGGISGAASTWENRNISISIQFFNDAVKIKTFTTPNNNDTHIGGNSTQN